MVSVVNRDDGKLFLTVIMVRDALRVWVPLCMVSISVRYNYLLE